MPIQHPPQLKTASLTPPTIRVLLGRSDQLNKKVKKLLAMA
jgi:hypothetical protein